MAIASFVLSLCGLLFIWVPGLGTVLLILAIIFGFIGLNKIKHNPGLGGKTFAIIGLVLGFLLFVFSIVLLVVTFSWILIGNNLDDVSSDIGLNVKCMDLGVNLIDFKELDSGSYEVTLKRTYTGDTFDGINLFFSKGQINLGGGSFGSLNPGEERSEIVFVGIEDAKLEGYTIFNVDEFGVEISCSEQVVKF